VEPTLRVEKSLERTVTGLGYELVHVERPQSGRLLRVYIDKPGGVGVEDCAFVSNHLTHALAVDSIDYDRLEVSSPGLDRPLVRERDFKRFAGARARLRLKVPLKGRRNLVGVLCGAEAGALSIDLGEGAITIDLSNVEKARLVPETELERTSREP